VHRTPGWAALRPSDGPGSPPRGTATYTRFLTALVARYGPHGSLWEEHQDVPRMAIRDWQVWNEPNFPFYWTTQPFAKPYVKLLRASRRALRAADPGARIILAGLANESWTALRAIYRAGGRGSFDAVALHPYTARPRSVLRIAELARRATRSFHDGHVPIWITELSWPAAKGKTRLQPGYITNERGQTTRLRAGLRLLASNRRRLRIAKVIWYTWLSREGPDIFGWAGLRRERAGRIVDAASFATFKRTARRLER
jgi:hypothetical protein